MPAPSNPFLPASPEALFRYQVVSAVLAWMAGGVVRADAVRMAAHETWLGPDSRLVTVSRRTVYRWLKAWTDRGPAGLEPRPRPRTETSDVLPARFVEFLKREHATDRWASIPEIIRRARQLGIVAPNQSIDRTTAWRTAKRMGLDLQRCKKVRDRDTRRWRYSHRGQLGLFDGKHFRAGAKRLRRVAIIYLDNATRYGLNGVVGTTETAALFLRGLFETVSHHGLFDMFYSDGGPAFTALDSEQVVQHLGVLSIHGESRYPQAHGGIERFNRTLLDELLRNWDENAAIDPDCAVLELRLKHYLREVYNRTPHEGLGDETPEQRWQRDTRPLRFVEDIDALRAKFLVEDTRKVSHDHVISVDSVPYEVPRGLAGKTIRFWRQVLDDHLYVFHRGRLVRIHPVDLEDNARSVRSRPGADEPPTPSNSPSAADLAFGRDLGPVTGPDGG